LVGKIMEQTMHDRTGRDAVGSGVVMELDDGNRRLGRPCTRPIYCRDIVALLGRLQRYSDGQEQKQ
jgi:hypothetical protein